MPKKIFVVEDEVDISFMIAHGLKKIGYEVFTCHNGQEALALGPQIKPDLIILDVGLPVVNGDKIASIFKADERLKHLPIILISSVVDGFIEKFEASGADTYLRKPFSFGELDNVIKKYCQ